MYTYIFSLQLIHHYIIFFAQPLLSKPGMLMVGSVLIRLIHRGSIFLAVKKMLHPESF